MNESILMAIESMCDDIATNPDANDNYKRAEAIMALTISGNMLPREAAGKECSDDYEQEPTTNITLPKPGTHFDYKGMEFIALNAEQGGLLAVAAQTLPDEMAFDEDDCNDWRSSTLREYLNKEHIKNFNDEDLLPFVSDLTADNGMKDYGTCEDKLAILSDAHYRTYREYIPKYDKSFVWSITSWSCLPTLAYTGRIVHARTGHIYYSIASSSYGVAPACIFNPKIFE